MIFARAISAGIGLVIGAGASQLPEYAQQYRQRLGGAVDELKAVVSAFDADAGKAGLSREAGLQRLESDSDTFVQNRGFQMQSTLMRAARLQQQQQDLASAAPFARIGIMLRDFDPAVARGAWSAFEPGLPVTSEGLAAGALGFLGGGLAFHMIGKPFRRRRMAAG